MHAELSYLAVGNMTASTGVLAILALVACAYGASVPVRQGVTQNPSLWPMPKPGAKLVDPLIIGGEPAAKAEFPHQVSLQASLLGLIEQHICGATIISPKWVLTAGHCIKGVPWYYSFYILAGKNNLGIKEEGQQRIKVKKSIAHEKYNFNSNQGVGPFDIGLLLLKQALVFSDTIKPATLPVQDAIPTGTAVLSGWGMDDPFDQINLPKLLQKVELPIIPFEECNAFVASGGGYNPLRDTNVCVGSLTESGKGSCSGDSGGPLIQTENGTVVVIGATSWGYTPCAVSPAPSVYTRVSAYVDWIEGKMKKY